MFNHDSFVFYFKIFFSFFPNLTLLLEGLNWQCRDTSPVVRNKCLSLLPDRNHSIVLSTFTLLFLSARTNTPYSASTTPSPTFRLRVSQAFAWANQVAWLHHSDPVRVIVSATKVSSPCSRSYFAYRYSILTRVTLGNCLSFIPSKYPLHPTVAKKLGLS